MSGRPSSAWTSRRRLPARQTGGRRRLAERRRRNRRRGAVAFSILLVIILGALTYGAWQSPVRIENVVVYGADKSLASFATDAMRGAYFGIIPRDSTFFVPRASIRARIMSMYPEIAAVSLFRNGWNGLSIKIDYRVPIARWCGVFRVASSTPSNDCYVFDANGFVYATTTTNSLVNQFILYEPLESDTPSIGITLPQATKFPAIFDFARELRVFGSPVTDIVIRDDEVDEYLASGTRVTYVLGDEQNAFTALKSADENKKLNLSDSSVDYIDLRFSGKVYLKKK